MRSADANRGFGAKTILFVDEIHRFNKAQQDAFLPFVEKGSIILIGATTENPSFEINGALLSRCKVFVLKPLETEDLKEILSRALSDSRGFGGMGVSIDDDLLETISVFANSDARNALSTLEMAVLNSPRGADGRIVVTREIVEQCTSRKSLLYDKTGEEHYNLISALHKSMRNSDRTPQCIGSPACSKPARTPCILQGELSASPPKTLGLPIQRRWGRRCGVPSLPLYRNAGMFCALDRGCRVYVDIAEIKRALHSLREREIRRSKTSC